MAVTTYPVLDALRIAYTGTSNPALRVGYGDLIGTWNLAITPIHDILEATLNLANGQLLIGSTSAGRPVKAVITGSGGITVTNSSGGINISYVTPPVPTTTTRTTLSNVTVGQVVFEALSGSNTCDLASNTNLACLNRILGIATTTALTGNTVTIQQLGDLAFASGFTKGNRLYLGTAGNLTITPPTLGTGYIYHQLAIVGSSGINISFANGTAFLV